MTVGAKRRASSSPIERDRDMSSESASRPPLAGPSGPQVFDVDGAGAGERLDRFLSEAAAERRVSLSRTRLKALIEAGEVNVDGKVARDPSMRLIEGARIVFEAPPPEESPLAGEDLPLALVYEDEHLIVIDKPAGTRRSSGARPFGRHPRQRADPPLRAEPLGRRRSEAAGHRAPAR